MTDELKAALEGSEQRYRNYLDSLEALVQTLLRGEDIFVQSVTSRVKSIPSALRTASRPDHSIKDISDLHDFAGVRVITYFADQVDEVARLFTQSFEIDDSRTKDRRDTIDPDRFGYLSMHMAIRLDETRRSLPEWSEYADIWTEVQIRSSLQHSWAEIEHDLGYKPSISTIPAHFRRRFSRLAGLLELADEEFVSLRDQLGRYSSQVADDLVSGGDAPLDEASMRAFISGNEELHALDKKIARRVGASEVESPALYYAGSRVEELTQVGCKTIKDVQLLLRERAPVIERLADAWLRTPHPSEQQDDDDWEDAESDGEGHWRRLSRGVSLFYLYLDRLAERDAEALLNTHVASLETEEDVLLFLDKRQSIIDEVTRGQ